MKAVILAAGKSTRTYPLTVTRPKALLEIGNKTILSLLLDTIVGVSNDVIIVVNYKKEMIKQAFGNRYKSITITYVEQKEPKGSADALLYAEPYINTEFLVLNGDDFFRREDIQKLCKEKVAILAQKIDNPKDYGVLEVKDNNLVAIEEKPAKPKSRLVNTGAYMLTKDIFPLLKKVKKSKRGEYELTDVLGELTKRQPVKVIEAKYWRPVTYPWHLLDVNKILLNSLKFKNNGRIEPGATIHGPVTISKGTVIRSGSYIEGPVTIGENCTIGPNCYIRPSTTIGNQVKVGNAVEIKNSIVGHKTSIGHLSYIGDSIIGQHVNIGAGTIVANLRHDNETIKSQIKNKLVDTEKRKFGTIIGDGVHTGIHTSIYPGRKLWSETTTIPGEIVKIDKQKWGEE